MWKYSTHLICTIRIALCILCIPIDISYANQTKQTPVRVTKRINNHTLNTWVIQTWSITYSGTATTWTSWSLLLSWSITGQYQSWCQPSIDRITMDAIYTSRSSRVQDAREEVQKANYVYDPDLSCTAQKRADDLKSRNITTGTHRRKPSDAYYDYQKINQRFVDNGFSGSAMMESVWRWYYTCTSDCTQALITSIRTTYDFFMREKKQKWPHYKSLVSGTYDRMWLGISVDYTKRRYWLVLHVGKK